MCLYYSFYLPLEEGITESKGGRRAGAKESVGEISLLSTPPSCLASSFPPYREAEATNVVQAMK